MPKTTAEVEWDQPELFEMEPVEREKPKLARRPKSVESTEYEQPALFDLDGAA